MVLVLGVIAWTGCGDNGSKNTEQNYQDSHALNCEQARQETYNALRADGYSASQAQEAADAAAEGGGC